MLRQNWSPALISLVKHLGPKNVYVSVLESGSWDGTKAALMDLDKVLGEVGVERTIDLGMDREAQLEELKHVPAEGEDRNGWLYTGRKESESGWEMRRIPYLARLRNKAMEPLLKIWDEGRGRRFDRVLWINDVVFTVCCWVVHLLFCFPLVSISRPIHIHSPIPSVTKTPLNQPPPRQPT